MKVNDWTKLVQVSIYSKFQSQRLRKEHKSIWFIREDILEECQQMTSIEQGHIIKISVLYIKIS